MDAAGWIKLSSHLLFIAFIIYLLGSFIFVISILGKKWSNLDPEEHQRKWGRLGILFAVLGMLAHLGYVLSRWLGQGHIPLTSMFEYMTFLALTIIIAFLIIHKLYGVTSLGAFVLPLTLTLIGWASVFDQSPTPLIPALQSNWLTFHVSLTALSQGIFAVSFAAGLMYVLRTVDQSKASRQTGYVEFFLAVVLMLVGFVVTTTIFSSLGYQASFQYVNERNVTQEIEYTLPPIAGPYEGIPLKEDQMQPLISTPSWMKGIDAPRKFNTLIWSILSGTILYVLLRLIFRRRLGAVIQPWLMDLKPALLDEISYRAIAIAFPIFTLGGLIFAMIWAEQAWGRFWGWDPKEIWALITWLFYSAYLHLRLSKGWHGSKSAWLAVGGFIVIMFNLVFVNLVVAGLHSYAG